MLVVRPNVNVPPTPMEVGPKARYVLPAMLAKMCEINTLEIHLQQRKWSTHPHHNTKMGISCAGLLND